MPAAATLAGALTWGGVTGRRRRAAEQSGDLGGGHGVRHAVGRVVEHNEAEHASVLVDERGATGPAANTRGERVDHALVARLVGRVMDDQGAGAQDLHLLWSVAPEEADLVRQVRGQLGGIGGEVHGEEGEVGAPIEHRHGRRRAIDGQLPEVSFDRVRRRRDDAIGDDDAQSTGSVRRVARLGGDRDDRRVGSEVPPPHAATTIRAPANGRERRAGGRRIR